MNAMTDSTEDRLITDTGAGPVVVYDPARDEQLLAYFAAREQSRLNDTVSTWRAMTTLERRLTRLVAFYGWHVGLAHGQACRAAGWPAHANMPIPPDRTIMEMVQSTCTARLARMLKRWPTSRDARRARRLACEVGVMAFVRGVMWGRPGEGERDSFDILFEVIAACRAFTSDRHYQVIQHLQQTNASRRRARARAAKRISRQSE